MIKQKYFIITVDTEGDNLWTYKTGEKLVWRMPSFSLVFNHCVKNMVLSLFI